MITEIMTLLIAVGAVMIFVVWNQSKKRRQNVEERREVEESTGKLKQELEKTATEIIGRMESQVSNLEDLLDESEKNRTILEGRVAELKKLLRKSEGQSTEIRDLLAKLEEASDNIEDLQRKLEVAEKKIAMYISMPMQMPMQSTMMPITTPLMTPMMTPMMTAPPPAPLPNVPSPISPPPILSSRQSTASSASVSSNNLSPSSIKTNSAIPKTVSDSPKETKKNIKESEPEDNEANDFAKMLQKSMINEKTETKPVVKTLDRRRIVVPSKTNQRINVISSEQPVKIESQRSNTLKSSTISSTQKNTNNKTENRENISDSAKIKNMLLEGMSVEDIARETGVGRGAVELVQEMTRRKLERKS